MFEIIVSQFFFLEELYGFQKEKEEMKGKYYVVHYKNEFVWMEIGAITESVMAIEIRKITNGVLANYHDVIGCVNLDGLKSLLTDWDYEQKKWGAFTISSLAMAIRQHINYYITDSWYEKEQLLGKNVIAGVMVSMQDYLASKGFYFSKSHRSQSSFLHVEFDEPDLEYTNGTDILRIYHIIDLHAQYFCYHIEFNRELVGGVFSSGSAAIDEIGDIIRKKLV